MREATAITTIPRPAYRRRPALLRFPKAAVGLAIVALVVLLAVFASWIAPYPPTEMHPVDRFVAPSQKYLLGTDFYGRDLLSRILVGYRVSLLIAFLSVGFALTIGGSLGIVAGYYGGTVDTIVMRTMDVLFAFPVLLLAITIVVVLGPGTLTTVLAIGIVYVPIFARIARGPTLVTREHLYIEAAKALGAPSFRILLRHVLPNVSTPILVQASINLATAILFESALSFLGLGAQPPYPSLGMMVSEGRNFLELSPWPTVFPGLAIVLAVLGFNLIGDALQEILDPRLRPTWTGS
ncbi:MAG: ABC transporter permease [Armatimonadota bacterium]|nr:ABC transporter permease [Armatimonadota bacterium]